jgi:hypothetical protein
MKVVTAPDLLVERDGISVFLAGGITGCPDWQSEVIELLREDINLRGSVGDNAYVLNPRRPDFDVNNHTLSEQQIRWEFEHINRADLMLFWFPAETLCPITLYELGRAVGSNKKVFIGIHPEYKRKFDLEVQCGLLTGGRNVISSTMEDLVFYVARHIRVKFLGDANVRRNVGQTHFGTR